MKHKSCKCHSNLWVLTLAVRNGSLARANGRRPRVRARVGHMFAGLKAGALPRAKLTSKTGLIEIPNRPPLPLRLQDTTPPAKTGGALDTISGICTKTVRSQFRSLRHLLSRNVSKANGLVANNDIINGEPYPASIDLGQSSLKDNLTARFVDTEVYDLAVSGDPFSL